MRPKKALQQPAVHSMHVYEVRPRSDKRGFNLISDVLPFGRLWYSGAVKLIVNCSADVWLLSAVKRAIERHCPAR
jgi:hypothetical protein